MSMIVVLATDDLIDGVPRVAGQVVTVSDGYANVRRIISRSETVAQANQDTETALTWRKFVDMFKAQYPDFLYVEEKFPALVAAVSARPALIQRLMVEPQLIIDMLASEEYAMQVIGEYPA